MRMCKTLEVNSYVGVQCSSLLFHDNLFFFFFWTTTIIYSYRYKHRINDKSVPKE